MIKCRSFDDVKNVYGEENLIKIANIKQIVTYANMRCQPVWVDEEYGGKIVAIYFKPECKIAWEYWKLRKSE